MKNRHVGVNFDDRDMPVKKLPKEEVEGTSNTSLNKLLNKLQNKNIKYNKNYYTMVRRKNPRAINPDAIEDPRTLYDIEQENIDLKE